MISDNKYTPSCRVAIDKGKKENEPISYARLDENNRPPRIEYKTPIDDYEPLTNVREDYNR